MRADVWIELADATDEEEVGPLDLALADFADDSVAVTDEPVAGIVHLDLQHAHVIALDQANAGLGQGGDRHQRCALGQAPAIVSVLGAGHVGDEPDGYARGLIGLFAHMSGEAAQGV